MPLINAAEAFRNWVSEKIPATQDAFPKEALDKFFAVGAGGSIVISDETPPKIQFNKNGTQIDAAELASAYPEINNFIVTAQSALNAPAQTSAPQPGLPADSGDDNENQNNPMMKNKFALLASLAAGGLLFLFGGQAIGIIGALVAAVATFFIASVMGADGPAGLLGGGEKTPSPTPNGTQPAAETPATTVNPETPAASAAPETTPEQETPTPPDTKTPKPPAAGAQPPADNSAAPQDPAPYADDAPATNVSGKTGISPAPVRKPAAPPALPPISMLGADRQLVKEYELPLPKNGTIKANDPGDERNVTVKLKQIGDGYNVIASATANENGEFKKDAGGKIAMTAMTIPAIAQGSGHRIPVDSNGNIHLDDPATNEILSTVKTIAVDEYIVIQRNEKIKAEAQLRAQKEQAEISLLLHPEITNVKHTPTINKVITEFDVHGATRDANKKIHEHTLHVVTETTPNTVGWNGTFGNMIVVSAKDENKHDCTEGIAIPVEGNTLYSKGKPSLNVNRSEFKSVLDNLFISATKNEGEIAKQRRKEEENRKAEAQAKAAKKPAPAKSASKKSTPVEQKEEGHVVVLSDEAATTDNIGIVKVNGKNYEIYLSGKYNETNGKTEFSKADLMEVGTNNRLPVKLDPDAYSFKTKKLGMHGALKEDKAVFDALRNKIAAVAANPANIVNHEPQNKPAHEKSTSESLSDLAETAIHVTASRNPLGPASLVLTGKYMWDQAVTGDLLSAVTGLPTNKPEDNKTKRKGKPTVPGQ